MTESIDLIHRKIGSQHVLTIKSLPGFMVAHEDEATAFAGVPSALESYCKAMAIAKRRHGKIQREASRSDAVRKAVFAELSSFGLSNMSDNLGRELLLSARIGAGSDIADGETQLRLLADRIAQRVMYGIDGVWVTETPEIARTLRGDDSKAIMFVSTDVTTDEDDVRFGMQPVEMDMSEFSILPPVVPVADGEWRREGGEDTDFWRFWERVDVGECDLLRHVDGEGEWHLGAMNDALFVLDKAPSPSNDHPWHDSPNGPEAVAPALTGLPHAVAHALVDAHNDIVQKLKGAK